MKKKILFIYNEPPVNNSGGNIRTNKLIKAALTKYDVTLLTLPKRRDDYDLKNLKKEFPSLRIVVANIFLRDLFKFKLDDVPKIFLNRYFLLRLKRIFGKQTLLTKKHYQQMYALRLGLEKILSEEKFNFIQVEHSYFAYVLDGLKIEAKKILDFHNVHSAMCSKKAKKLFQKEEKDFSKIYDVALVCSKKESSNLEHANFKSTVVVPNGVDMNYFKFQKITNLHKALFVGDLSYEPNKEGALWFVKKISPFLPKKYVTQIIGRSPGKLKRYKSKRIQISGFVEDINKHAKNSVFVVPLKSGGGTRLKILMAASIGMPIVSTAKGTEGLGFKKDVDICIAETPFEFVVSFEKLEDVNFRTKLVKNANLKVQSYSWEKIGQKYTKQVLKQ